jgi:hypothetical protein
VAPGVRFAAVATRQLVIQREKATHPLVFRVEGRAAPIDIAHADHAAGRQQLSNLAECIDRLAQVLQHLIVEYGFERFRSEARLMDIPDLEGQVPSCLGFCQRSRRFDHARRWIDPDRLGRFRAFCQTGGNGPRPAADIEQPHARLEEWEKKRGGRIRRSLGVVGND